MWWGRFFLLMVVLGVSSYAQESRQIGFCDTGGCSQPKCVYRDPCCYNYYSSGNHHVEVGGNYTYLNFKPEGFGSVSGSLGGIQASYEYLPLNCIYQGVTFLWREGPLSGSGPSRSFFDIDTQARIGYTFGDSCDAWILSLFTGVGYRHMGERVDLLHLNYNTIYIPVGFTSDWKINDNWYIGANFQWRPQAYPTLKIDPLEGARWITKCTLANCLVEIPVTYALGRDSEFAIILKPFFEYWQDGQTTASASGIFLGVPKNTYLFGGFMLNLGYSF